MASTIEEATINLHLSIDELIDISNAQPRPYPEEKGIENVYPEFIFFPVAKSIQTAFKVGTMLSGVTRTLDDLSSLRGATWKEAKNLIPKGWTRGPLKKGKGIKFVNPNKKGEQILLEKGWPGAKDPLHAGPYMKISRNGKVTRIPLAGNPTLK